MSDWEKLANDCYPPSRMKCDWLVKDREDGKAIFCGRTYPEAREQLDVDYEEVGNVFWRKAESVPDFLPEEDVEADPFEGYRTDSWNINLRDVLTSFEVIESCSQEGVRTVGGIMMKPLAIARQLLHKEKQFDRFINEVNRLNSMVKK